MNSTFKCRPGMIIVALVGLLFGNPFSGFSQSLFQETSRYATAVIRVFSQIIKYPLPKSWGNNPVFRNNTPVHFIIEFLPQGQILSNWTDMLTIQGFRGGANNPNAKMNVLLELQKKELRDIAPDKFYYRELFGGIINGYPGAIRLMGVKELPSEKPSSGSPYGEIGIYMILFGKNDIYNIHRSWRTVKPFSENNLPMSENDIQEWTNIFRSIVLIDAK